jgi:pimeloyl-ACP methyl ester carboxylesterase
MEPRVEGRMLDLGDATVCVREWGGDGVPFVFWHGLGGYTGLYLGEIAPALVDAGLRPVGIDPPGIGRSPALPPERYRMDALAALAAALVGALDAGPVVFAGHSWGGQVGCHLTAVHPELVRALVLFDAGYLEMREFPDAAPGRSLAEWIERERPRVESFAFPDEDAFRTALEGHFGRLTPAMAAALRAGMVERDGRLVDGMAVETVAAANKGAADDSVVDTHAALAASGVPVLLIARGRPLAPAERGELEEMGLDEAGFEQLVDAGLARFRANLPAATVLRHEGCGHDPIADLGPGVVPLVAEWLAARTPS